MKTKNEVSQDNSEKKTLFKKTNEVKSTELVEFENKLKVVGKFNYT